MAINIDVKFDTSDFDRKIVQFSQRIVDQSKKALLEIGREILRLSSFEVPHDTGMLQASGKAEPALAADEVVVGYNKVYAARLHEHPEYHFQKGRKGKYLEDPIKTNMRILLNYYGNQMKEVLR